MMPGSEVEFCAVQEVKAGSLTSLSTGIYGHACASLEAAPSEDQPNLVCWGNGGSLQNDVPKPLAAMERSFKEVL